MSRSHITTHVLDAVNGLPATGLTVALEAWTEEGWETIAEGVTDTDGRISTLGPDALPSGYYRVTFETGTWFADRQAETFYPEVQITVDLADETAHYHVPLLLSPFAYSTYRGS